MEEYINLLPLRIVQKRRLQRLAVQLVTLQAVLVMSLLIAVRLLDIQIQNREGQATQQTALLLQPRFTASEYAALALAEALGVFAAQDALVALLDLPYFDRARLTWLLDTTPLGVQLLHIDMDEVGVRITAATHDLYAADAHLYNWQATGLLHSGQRGGQLVSVVRQNDGTMHYILALVWDYE